MVQFSSVTQSCPTLWPHESQHARPPCPLPTLGVYPNSCPSSRWCHPAISSSVVPFSCPQSLPASGSFLMSQLFAWGGQRSNHKELFCIVVLILVTSSNLFRFCEVLTVSVLYHVHPCMKYSLDISNFLEESSSPSHSIIFFYFFALFILEGLLFSSCYALELCIQLGISFPFLLCLLLLFFPQLFVMPPQTTTLPSCISFPWRRFWSLPPVWCYEPPSIVLQVLCLSDLIP